MNEDDPMGLRHAKEQQAKVLRMIHWSITIALAIALACALTQLGYL